MLMPVSLSKDMTEGDTEPQLSAALVGEHGAQGNPGPSRADPSSPQVLCAAGTPLPLDGQLLPGPMSIMLPGAVIS